MQRSWPRVRTKPLANSSRYFAGRINRPFSSRRGVYVPRNTQTASRLKEATCPIPLYFAPLYSTSLHCQRPFWHFEMKRERKVLIFRGIPAWGRSGGIWIRTKLPESGMWRGPHSEFWEFPDSQGCLEPGCENGREAARCGGGKWRDSGSARGRAGSTAGIKFTAIGHTRRVAVSRTSCGVGLAWRRPTVAIASGPSRRHGAAYLQAEGRSLKRQRPRTCCGALAGVSGGGGSGLRAAGQRWLIRNRARHACAVPTCFRGRS